MPLHYVVAPNCTITAPGISRDSFGPGTILRVGQNGFTEKNFAEHMASGFLREVRTEDDIAQTKIEQTDVVPGVDSSHVLDGTDEDKSVTVVVEADGKSMQTHGNPAPQPEKVEKPDQVTSIWNLDPDTLKDHDLDALNTMILERDGKVVPYSDESEAIAHLSQHYVSPVVV